MKVEAGKYYRTADQRVFGPMVDDGSFGGIAFIEKLNDGRGWDIYGKPIGTSHKGDETLLSTAAPVTKASTLDAAKDAVADRGLNYGKPEDNFRRIADLWTSHLRNKKGNEGYLISVDTADVAMMMALMKIARLQNDPNHLDSWTDLAGYAACGAEITNGDEKDA